MSQTATGDATALPRSTDDPVRARYDLDHWGYCLLTSAIDSDRVGIVRDRLIDQAAAEEAAGIGSFDTGEPASRYGRNRVEPGSNQRVSSLLNKGIEFHELALNPIVHQLLEGLLGKRFLLTSFTANIAAPGGVCQTLHQDQGYVHRPQPLYPIVVNVAWFLDDVTAENGGTRVVPASHLFAGVMADLRPPTIGLEGPAGTAVLMDGRLWHGTGANQTSRPRHVLLANYCRAWVRQQENWFLSLAPEVQAALSAPMRQLLGYKTWGTLGGVPDAVDEDGYVSRPERFTTRMSREIHH